MPFVSDIVKYDSLSIVGLEKNTGKTEALNYILRRLPSTGGNLHRNRWRTAGPGYKNTKAGDNSLSGNDLLYSGELLQRAEASLQSSGYLGRGEFYGKNSLCRGNQKR